MDVGSRSVRMLVASKPVSTFISRKKLRISRPEPTSSTNASATSTTISVSRRRLRPALPLDPRPSSFIEDARSGLVACSAGAIPNNRPVMTEMAIANSSTRVSISTTISRAKANSGSASLIPFIVA